MTKIELESLKLFKHNTYRFTITLDAQFQKVHNLNVHDQKTIRMLLGQINALRCCAERTNSQLMCPHCCVAKDARAKESSYISPDAYYVSIKSVESKQHLTQSPSSTEELVLSDETEEESAVFLSNDLGTPTDTSPAQPKSPNSHSSTSTSSDASQQSIKLTIVRKGGSSLPVVASSVSKDVSYGSNGSVTFSGYVKPICSSSRNHLHCNVVLVTTICDVVVSSLPFALQARRIQSTKQKKPDAFPAKRGRPQGSTNKAKRAKLDAFSEQNPMLHGMRTNDNIPSVYVSNMREGVPALSYNELAAGVLNSYYAFKYNNDYMLNTVQSQQQQQDEVQTHMNSDFESNCAQLCSFEDNNTNSVFTFDMNYSDFNEIKERNDFDAFDSFGTELTYLDLI